MGEIEVLRCEKLVRNYDSQTSDKAEEPVRVLKGLDFAVKQGTFMGIMGKSGCGKTTLLKTLGLIDKQTSGTLFFMGTNTENMDSDERADIRRNQIGFVFQDYYLMDSLTVKENIMLPMILNKEPVEKMTKEAEKLAKQFQIEHLLQKDPYELSGGEKQRVAICRALFSDPDLILADEPTGNLDSKSGKIVIEALERINTELGKTVVMVTHDPQMARYCKEIILLKDGMILETLKKANTTEEFCDLLLERVGDL